ncbi:unnamed protein product, partial [Leptidea sinapis]
SEAPKRDAVLDHINNGAKFVQDFLGTDSIALKVANFVVRAFQTGNIAGTKAEHDPSSAESPLSPGHDHFQDKAPNYNINEKPSFSLWRQLIKVLGLQSNQISAVAINALIFLAQMIATILSGPKRQTAHRNDDLQTWILNKNSRRLQDIIATAKNESLPEHIEQIIDDNEDTSCIRLLICKITPFVNNMQKAVFRKDFNDENINDSKEKHGASLLYRHLPSEEEISSKGEICERRYKDCDLNE